MDWPVGFHLDKNVRRRNPTALAERLIDFTASKDGLVVRDAFSRLGTAALSNTPLRLAQFEREELDRFTLAHTKDKVFKLNNATDVWDDITRVSGSYTGNNDNPWHSAVVLNQYVFTNYLDKIQYWDGDAANADDLTAADAGNFLENTKAKYLASFGGRLVIANLIEGANVRAVRVRWSREFSFLEDADWDGSILGAGFADLAETPDEITGIGRLGNIMVIYKKRSIVHMIETGNVNAPFRFQHRGAAGPEGGTGLAAQDTLAEITNEHIGLFNDNVYRYNGTGKPVAIGDPVIKRVIKEAGTKNLRKAFATTFPSEGWYLLWVPLQGQTFALQAYIYDYNRNVWIGEWNKKAATASIHVETADLTWDNAPGTWDEAEFTWDSIRQEVGAATPIIAEPDDMEVQKIDETASFGGTATWITESLDFGHPNRMIGVKRVKLRIDSLGLAGVLGCGVSIDDGRTYVGGSSRSYAAGTGEQDIYFDFLQYGRIMKFKFTATTKVRITGWEVEYSIRGKAA
jgi:hypothetical protein